jgi:hypothetical protein
VRSAFAAFGAGINFAGRDSIFGPTFRASQFKRFGRSSFFLLFRQQAMAFAAFGGHAGFFDRYAVGSSAIRTTDNMVIHQFLQCQLCP